MLSNGRLHSYRLEDAARFVDHVALKTINGFGSFMPNDDRLIKFGRVSKRRRTNIVSNSSPFPKLSQDKSSFMANYRVTLF